MLTFRKINNLQLKYLHDFNTGSRRGKRKEREVKASNRSVLWEKIQILINSKQEYRSDNTGIKNTKVNSRRRE